MFSGNILIGDMASCVSLLALEEKILKLGVIVLVAKLNNIRRQKLQFSMPSQTEYAV